MSNKFGLVKVFVIENDPGEFPFIVGERVSNLGRNKYRYKKEILISKEFARLVVSINRSQKIINNFCKDSLYGK